jgi:hypothetical protein
LASGRFALLFGPSATAVYSGREDGGRLRREAGCEEEQGQATNHVFSWLVVCVAKARPLRSASIRGDVTLASRESVGLPVIACLTERTAAGRRGSDDPGKGTGGCFPGVLSGDFATRQ